MPRCCASPHPHTPPPPPHACEQEASKEFSHLEEHARFLDAKTNRWGGLLAGTLAARASNGNAAQVLGSLNDETEVS